MQSGKSRCVQKNHTEFAESTQPFADSVSTNPALFENNGMISQSNTIQADRNMHALKTIS